MNHIELALDCIREAVVCTDDTGSILWCNKPFSKLSGLDSSQIINTKIEDRLILFRNSTLLSAKDYPYPRVYKQREEVEELYEMSGSDQAINIEICGHPIEASEGKLSAVFVIRDVTKRIRMEQQFLQSRKLEAIGSLAAGIAHEINTPAQYIRDNITFLQDEMQKLLNYIRATHDYLSKEEKDNNQNLKNLSQQAEDLDFNYIKDEVPQAIEQSIEGIARIAEIVRSVKAFAHPGTKEFTYFDLNECIKTAAEVSRNEWKYVAELKLELANNLKKIHGHADEINQVILNLIVNAAHAIDKQQQNASAQELGAITIKTRLLPRAIEMIVTDSGSGIPKEIQSKIFDPFFTTKPIGKGTGQGLSLAWRVIVEQHGGSLLFTSTPERGTSFMIILPLQQINKTSEQVVSAQSETKN